MLSRNVTYPTGELEMQDEIAGAANVPAPPPMPKPVEVKEVFPIRFDKDYLDFRGTPEDDEMVPKASSAPASAGTQTSPTGLEDLYDEDSVKNALNNVGRGTTSPSENGS